MTVTVSAMERFRKWVTDPYRRRVPSVVWRILGTIFAALLLTFFVVSFIQGRPVTGKSSRGVTEAFEAYGPDAFAADSASYLTFIGAALALYIASWLTRARTYVHVRALTIASIATAVAGSVASIVLLAIYWSSGMPFHNFEAEKLADLQTFMYGSSFVVPGIALVGAIAIGVVVLGSQTKAEKAQKAQKAQG